MSTPLTVNNIIIDYPAPGDTPGWGQAASDWAQQVTLALADLQGSTDIPQKTFTIQNNVSSFSDIVGLTFNTGLVRAAFIEYSVYRTSTGTPSGTVEAGSLTIVYDNLAGSGSKWQIAAGPIVGNAGITFSITDAGQFQYKSTNLGIGHSGNMHFKAKSLGQ